jgi:hypothetical protein
MRPRMLGANTIMPSLFQEPPAGLRVAGAKVWTASVARLTRFSLLSAKKASASPAGDQNGRAAPSVPARVRTAPFSSDRTYKYGTPFASAV